MGEGPYFTFCRHNCCGKQGKVQKLVPYDRVQDVQVSEPAGNYCCLFPYKLTLVKVQTAGGSVGHNTTWLPGSIFVGDMVGNSELELWGLSDPNGFRAKVMEAKRIGKAMNMGPAQMSMGATTFGDPKTMELFEEQVSLLKSIDSSMEQLCLLTGTGAPNPPSRTTSGVLQKVTSGQGLVKTVSGQVGKDKGLKKEASGNLKKTGSEKTLNSKK